MRRAYTPPKVTRQEVHFVPKTRIIELPVKPYRVWSLYETDPAKRPELPMTPHHHYNAFLEDYVHDWNYGNGKLHYSRVALDSLWILCEFTD